MRSVRRGRAGLFTCALVGLLATPTFAAAKPGYIVFPGGHGVELHLEGSNGYSIDITRVGRSTEATASNGSSAVTYLPRPGHPRDDGVDARLPGVGRISVRFHPTGKAQGEPGFFPPCKGGRTTTRRGYFQGVIRLRGERGFTTVRASRARGSVVTKARETCKRSIFGPSEPQEEANTTQLFASMRSHRRAIAFAASAIDLLTKVFTNFFATTFERREGMVILRQAIVSTPKSSFALGDSGDHPASATVAPPEPFHGSAVFERGENGENSWTGSLSVALPGAGRVRMAGPGFSARLCRNDGCRPSGGQVLVASGPGANRYRRSTRARSSAWLSTTKSASIAVPSPGSSLRAR